jgi:glutamyl-tRNA reductase
MSLFALGLNHHTAPLAVRERVVFHVERMREALVEIRRGLASEAAILSTCNRTELYVAAEQPPAAVAQWMAQYHRFEPGELQRCRMSRPCATPSASPRAWIRWSWASRKSSAR